MRAQIAFNLSANGLGDYFTLDDTTKGVLDGATYLLAGDVLVDVTDTLRSVQVRRGRSRTLEKFTAGNANLVLDNRDRAYDPTNASSPYYGSILPRKQVVIEHLGYRLFTGHVEDWNFGYSLSGDSVAEPSCADGFALLSQTELVGGTQTAELSGTRVGAILDDVSWPATLRDLSAGAATLDNDVIPDGTNALAYLQKVETSEPGALFISRDGYVAFRDRNDLQSFSSGVTFGTGGVPFTGIGVVYGTEEMTNAVNVTYTDGTAVAGTATASNATSQTAYGVMDATYDTVLGSNVDAQALADWIVGTYGEPRYRVDSITVSLDGITGTQAAQVLGLELGDVVLVTWTPNGTGSALSQYCNIDGIEHSATPASHSVTFTLSEALSAFILDDPVMGLLDSSSLGF